MRPTREQAVNLLRALFDEDTAGVDGEGNTYGAERNAHFLACMRTLFGDLPSQYEMLKWIAPVPDNAEPEHYLRRDHTKQVEKRAVFSTILRAWADALDGSGRPVILDPLAKCQSCDGNGGYHKVASCSLFEVTKR